MHGSLPNIKPLSAAHGCVSTPESRHRDPGVEEATTFWGNMSRA